MNAQEKVLLERVFREDPGAFEELLDRYRALIYSVFQGPAFHFPHDYMDDLYQSFVLALRKDDYRKLRAFEGRNSCSLATFLQIVTTRFGLDERRKWRRHPRGRGMAGVDEAVTPVMEQEDPDAEPVDTSSLRKEEIDIFHNLLFSIDWKRISAVLWVFHGVERERIADVMATSRANIDALYKRAKDQMTDLYQSGAGSRNVRAPDPQVLTTEVTAALRRLLAFPSSSAREKLLEPGAKRQALLGLVLLEYPRFRCSAAELAKIAETEDVPGACLELLTGLEARLAANGS